MDQFAQLAPDERRAYFEAAAANLGNMSAEIIQKDFWVCWTLKNLFGLDDIGAHLTFKGGTSLSKVYGIIKRFSEDIDVAIERDYLGFGDLKGPEHAAGTKERERRLQSLKVSCQDTVKGQILTAFSARCESLLKPNSWSLAIDANDSDRQTLLFTFPNAIDTGLQAYVRPVVKIELGARSDHWPAQQASIKPYLHDAFPAALSEPSSTIRVLAAERTFWEKATILHMLHHWPATKLLPIRMSRHYCDFYMLLGSIVKDLALKDDALLTRVAEHKSVFFRAASAKYEEAKRGTLRLAPPDHRCTALRTDYAAMSSMFFDTIPDLEVIIATISAFEQSFNGD
ncbi:MAG: nucleotidyl transferase AbiEii/AbiGii toxin family protein [Deltaproteobacteria bacterium]|nr:nucleotidyl transferase AbiEii/AbiGii toxin family protein [Deltaproteobacteria bacterium]